MTFSQEWDTTFKENKNISIWPWSDLVSFVMRYARPSGPQFRVLELGCGAGANIPFFLSLGIQYYGIEGSATIIKRLREKFPSLKDNLIIGDFTSSIPFQGDFDLVVDRSAVTHNPTIGIKKCLEEIHKILKAGGKYIGIDWFSTLHSDYKEGKDTEDDFTRTGYQTGQFAYVGRVHFSDRLHLEGLLGKFSILILEHKIVKREIPDNSIFAAWNFVAKKIE